MLCENRSSCTHLNSGRASWSRLKKNDTIAGGAPPAASFRPIFRIEGAADNLDPEDWIPVTCGRRMSLAKGFSSPTRFSRHTQPRFQGREHQFQSGSKRCSPSHRKSLFTIVWNDCYDQLELRSSSSRGKWDSHASLRGVSGHRNPARSSSSVEGSDVQVFCSRRWDIRSRTNVQLLGLASI